MARNKNFLDWTLFTTPAGGADLRQNAIRKTLKYDIYQDKTKFKALALTDMHPLSQEAATIITQETYDIDDLSSDDLASLKNVRWIFRARILGPDSPHNFIPDPCDTTYIQKKEDMSKAMSYIQMHTQFITPTDFDMNQGRGLVRQGDVVWVELDKNVAGYDLQMGRFISKIKKDHVSTGQAGLETEAFYCDNLRDIFNDRDASRVPIGGSGPVSSLESPSSTGATPHPRCGKYTRLNDILEYDAAIASSSRRQTSIVRSANPLSSATVKSRVEAMAANFGMSAPYEDASPFTESNPAVYPHIAAMWGSIPGLPQYIAGQATPKCRTPSWLAAHPAHPDQTAQYCWRSPIGNSSTTPDEGWGFHWSAAYVSYILSYPGSGFPYGASHQKYLRSGLTNRGITGPFSGRAGIGDGTWETFSLWSETVEINVGDVLVEDKCYNGSNHQSAHGDLVWKITGTAGRETLWLAGGNLSSKNVTKIKISAPNRLLGPAGSQPVTSGYYPGNNWRGVYKVVLKKMR